MELLNELLATVEPSDFELLIELLTTI